MTRFSHRFVASLICFSSGVLLCLGVSVQARSLQNGGDPAKACYLEPLPLLPVNTEKTVPWDVARGPDGCCASFSEVRSRIDEVDAALLAMLAKRATFVREAARFKSTRSVLNVPSRNEEVVERAVTGAVEVYLPQVVARSIFTAIINSSVVFEECVFDAFAGEV
ncbi:hypothetical protein FA13DRAFT_1777365 [Coprinellus micaceus]|uniref:Chorismate mutase domain-containing protein n=1 Tax=Coprinellus micaceus TaxID=71717 RepID=A0A4Y7SUD3_COPMI|nr:hypothetical protein FA13DRAFT_1777365 [Coprinellus micaceus]